MAKDLLDAVYGCLVGGATGDALGAPVEGLDYREIREQYGRLEGMIASPHDNTNQQPGGVTADTVLRQYVALAIARTGGRIGPGDLASLWLERGNFKLLRSNERSIYEKLSGGANPWDAGQGAILCATAVTAIAPVGIINAGDPAQAYRDGYAVASVTQDGQERDAAATLVAGIAAALGPETTLAGVVDAMVRHASEPMRRAIEGALDLAASSDSAAGFTERIYPQLTGWHMASPGLSSLEIIPVSLALLHFCLEDVDRAIIEGANFGRASNAIASIAGCIAGALSGVAVMRGDWVDTVERANRDLFEFLEDDPTANFYAMAWWLVKAFRAEREAAKARLQVLESLAAW